MSTQKKPIVDEDVDDLDDLLDEFSKPAPAPAASSSSSKPTVPPASSASAPTTAATVEDEDAFARELANDMEALMRELAGGPAAPASSSAAGAGTGTESKARQDAFMEAWEQLLAEGMGGEQGAAASEAGKGKESDREEVEDAFQKTIREAMGRMKVSEEGLQADAQASTAPGGDLAALLASLGDLGGEGGEGGQSEEELQDMLEGMMAQLMSKEILYDPLKELSEKFPGYLEENKGKLSAEDKKRFESQRVCVAKILTIFDKPGYTDEDKESATQIMTLMNEMQTYGSPPSELMGPLPTGFDVGPDGLPKIPEGCTIA